MEEERSAVGDRTVVEDVLLTDAFLIKGRVDGKFSRLFKVLDSYERSFLVVSSAVMTDLQRGEVIRTPRVHVNMNELLMAHELIDSAGDYYQKLLSAKGDDKSVRIRAFFNGAVSLELAGRIRPGAYENLTTDRRFFVMEDCAIRGLDASLSPDFEMLDELPYAIINRTKIAYLYDFSEPFK